MKGKCLGRRYRLRHHELAYRYIFDELFYSGKGSLEMIQNLAKALAIGVEAQLFVFLMFFSHEFCIILCDLHFFG